MSYVDDLLHQSTLLATLDKKRPKQANLRRAVSSAYYAVFHEFVDQSVSNALSAKDSNSGLGARLRRIAQHMALLKAVKWFEVWQNNQVPFALLEMRDGVSTKPHQDISDLCKVVRELQEWRHFADYNISDSIDRAETVRLISDAKSAVTTLRKMRSHKDVKILLWVFLFGDAIGRNT